MMTIAKDPKILPKYVYESPDGGKTIRKREFGSSKSTVLRENDDLYKAEAARIHRAAQLIEIMQCAETNPTLKDALEKLEMLYLLIKDEDTD